MFLPFSTTKSFDTREENLSPRNPRTLDPLSEILSNPKSQGDLVLFEFYLRMDIHGSFLGSFCLYIALDLFITYALRFLHIDDHWIICVACSFGVNKWSAPGL
ncbi:hypothetical protein DY000_02046050 [Brassica cretica]|uniref:Uncharacterized protein n=1 Tax=Brassica cretica TaxID=69181 RepID=A0ABQ7ENY7_BRACR|nr:hypothetical protein DY000_02046050 [Brassica cretica]